MFYQIRSWGSFHERFFYRNSNLMKTSLCSHPNYSKVVTTKLCTLYDSCAVIACAKFCSNMISYNGVTQKKFPLNFNYDGKIVCEKAPPRSMDSLSPVYIFSYGRRGYTYLIWLVPWLLMTWWCKGAAHQQPWYWPCLRQIWWQQGNLFNKRVNTKIEKATYSQKA